MIQYSVVITYCCNRTQELLLLVESIKNQTAKPSEILVITDGPAHELSFLEDDLLRIIMLDQNYRPAPLRNAGILEAKMDLIFITDDDDYWHPMKAEIQLKELAEHNAALCFTKKVNFRSDTELSNIEKTKAPKRLKVDWRKIKFTNLLIKNSLVLSSVLINRQFANIRFNEKAKYRAWEDYELWLRLAKDKKRIILLEIPLLYYRINTGSIRKNSLIPILKEQIKYGIKNRTIPWVYKPLFFLVCIVRLFYWNIKSFDVDKI